MADPTQVLSDFLRRLPRLDESAVSLFEEMVATAFGASHAVAVASGTAALHCALAAIGVGQGDEVLVPALSVVMSVVPVLYVGATPVFVDCQPDRVDFDYDDLARKVGPKTKAVIPVHLWGCAYDMSKLVDFGKEHGLAVIEDACQAHGSLWDKKQLGTWGAAGCFSMQEGKLLSVGEGGFILTSDGEIAATCRGFRNHWADPANPDLSYAKLGWNYRLTSLQAMLAAEQVRRFGENLSERRRQAEFLLSELSKIQELESYQYSTRETPNYHQVVVLLRRECSVPDLAVRLGQRGVLNSVGTFGLRPAMDRGAFRSVGADLKVGVPNTRALLARAVALIVGRGQPNRDLRRIARTIKDTIREYRRRKESRPE
jgi:dTDP-4-amino-4,6-dideoxygalactose transaminase